SGEAMARAQSGDVKAGLALLAEARGIVEGEGFSDIDRADVIYRLGVCRYMLSSIATAVGLFNEALALAERSGLPCDQLRLGGIEFLLGKPEQAVEHLKHAFAVALEIGRDEDAATAVNSLAQVHLRSGDPKRAEEQAVHALQIIGEREDMLDEVGNARLVLGRALLLQERLDEAESVLAGAEDAFAQ